MTRFLITGGAGYLGHQTAMALHGRGETVRILDCLEKSSVPNGVEYVRTDVLNSGALLQAMEGVDVVFHMAALVPLAKAGDRYWRVNVEGTQRVLDTAWRVGVQMVIYVSSSAVYGLPDRCPIDDRTPQRPMESYGRSKLEAENRVLEAAKGGLPCAIVRPRTIIGPGRLGIFKILFDWIYEGRRIYVIGNGEQRFQFVDARDLIEFMLILANLRKTGIYNIGAEHFGTLREDLTSLIQYARSGSRICGTPVWLTVGLLGLLDKMHLCPLSAWHYRSYHKAFYFDLSKPKKELAWRPRYSNRDSLIASYDSFLCSTEWVEVNARRSTHRKTVAPGILQALKHLS